jgi:phospholipase C
MAPAPIQNVVLLLLENHSFDHMLGGMPGVDGASPLNINMDTSGNHFHQHETTIRQMKFDPRHALDNVAIQLKDGNQGFVKDFCAAFPSASTEDRQEIMNYYQFGFLPALHQLAKDFTVCDRWFSSLPGPTWPNRFFALTGTSNGKVKMPQGIKEDLNQFFDQTQDTIFDRLNEAGVSWKVYYYDFPSSLLLNHQRRPENLAQYRRIEDFYVDVQTPGQLPRFSLVEPKYFGLDQNDDHPPHNVMKAEKLIADVYNGLRSSPHWESTLFIVYYDEHGGFYDHVVPPAAVPPDDKTGEYDFNQLGIRVPAIVVSPWVGRRVDGTTFDHTSVLRYLQDIWSLGSGRQDGRGQQSLSADHGERTASGHSAVHPRALHRTRPRPSRVGEERCFRPPCRSCRILLLPGKERRRGFARRSANAGTRSRMVGEAEGQSGRGAGRCR